MSDDFSQVTASWDKPSYNAGDTITGTVTGAATSTTTVTTTTQVGPVVVPLVADDGSQTIITLPAEQAQLVTTTTTSQGVTIDTTRAIVDNSPNPRTWAVSADKRSITATA